MAGVESLETRWFVPGPVPPAVAAWAAGATAQPPRQDRYLAVPETDALGIKTRDGRLEVKRRLAPGRPLALPGGGAGVAEPWVKWGVPAAAHAALPADDDPRWRTVPKRRWLWVFPAGAETPAADPTVRLPAGCGVELTELAVDGAPWWTVGAEAFGPDPVLALAPLGRLPFPLTPETAASYPAWLQRLARMED